MRTMSTILVGVSVLMTTGEAECSTVSQNVHLHVCWFLILTNANLGAVSPEYHDQIWGSTYDPASDAQPTKMI